MSLDSLYKYSLSQIGVTYGHHVSIDRDAKGLNKFGRNIDLDANVEEQVWVTGGSEDLPTDNLITHYASSNNADNAAVTIEGFTIDGDGHLTSVSQNVNLAGQTKTALSTPLARIVRLFNAGSTAFAGTVYVSRDVTYTSGVPASGIHATVLPADQQTLKCATSVDKNNYLILTDAHFSVGRTVTAAVDFKVQVRQRGGVWRTQFTTTLSSNSAGAEVGSGDNPLVVPPSSDIRVLATTTANNTTVDTTLIGVLGTILTFN